MTFAALRFLFNEGEARQIFLFFFVLLLLLEMPETRETKKRNTKRVSCLTESEIKRAVGLAPKILFNKF